MATLNFDLQNLPAGLPVDVHISGGPQGQNVQSVPIVLSTAAGAHLVARLEHGSEITANLGGNGKPIVARLEHGSEITASLGGNGNPIVAQLKPGSEITATVLASGPNGQRIEAHVGADVTIAGDDNPVSVEVGLRNASIRFLLFGWIPLLTIQIRP